MKAGEYLVILTTTRRVTNIWNAFSTGTLRTTYTIQEDTPRSELFERAQKDLDEGFFAKQLGCMYDLTVNPTINFFYAELSN